MKLGVCFLTAAHFKDFRGLRRWSAAASSVWQLINPGERVTEIGGDRQALLYCESITSSISFHLNMLTEQTTWSNHWLKKAQ